MRHAPELAVRTGLADSDILGNDILEQLALLSQGQNPFLADPQIDLQTEYPAKGLHTDEVQGEAPPPGVPDWFQFPAAGVTSQGSPEAPEESGDPLGGPNWMTRLGDNVQDLPDLIDALVERTGEESGYPTPFGNVSDREHANELWEQSGDLKRGQEAVDRWQDVELEGKSALADTDQFIEGIDRIQAKPNPQGMDVPANVGWWHRTPGADSIPDPQWGAVQQAKLDARMAHLHPSEGDEQYVPGGNLPLDMEIEKNRRLFEGGYYTEEETANLLSDLVEEKAGSELAAEEADIRSRYGATDDIRIYRNPNDPSGRSDQVLHRPAGRWRGLTGLEPGVNVHDPRRTGVQGLGMGQEDRMAARIAKLPEEVGSVVNGIMGSDLPMIDKVSILARAEKNPPTAWRTTEDILKDLTDHISDRVAKQKHSPASRYSTPPPEDFVGLLAQFRMAEGNTKDQLEIERQIQEHFARREHGSGRYAGAFEGSNLFTSTLAGIEPVEGETFNQTRDRVKAALSEYGGISAFWDADYVAGRRMTSMGLSREDALSSIHYDSALRDYQRQLKSNQEEKTRLQTALGNATTSKERLRLGRELERIHRETSQLGIANTDAMRWSPQGKKISDAASRRELQRVTQFVRRHRQGYTASPPTPDANSLSQFFVGDPNAPVQSPTGPAYTGQDTTVPNPAYDPHRLGGFGSGNDPSFSPMSDSDFNQPAPPAAAQGGPAPSPNPVAAVAATMGGDGPSGQYNLPPNSRSRAQIKADINAQAAEDWRGRGITPIFD